MFPSVTEATARCCFMLHIIIVLSEWTLQENWLFLQTRDKISVLVKRYQLIFRLIRAVRTSTTRSRSCRLSLLHRSRSSELHSNHWWRQRERGRIVCSISRCPTPVTSCYAESFTLQLMLRKLAFTYFSLWRWTPSLWMCCPLLVGVWNMKHLCEFTVIAIKSLQVKYRKSKLNKSKKCTCQWPRAPPCSDYIHMIPLMYP